MDSSAANFTIDEKGHCNYCSEFLASKITYTHVKKEGQEELHKIISRIKRKGERREYDCLVGISGGVDSSFLLTQVVALGLRPLVVHMDNGWNSEIAQNNIAKIIQILDVDYISHVIYWPEYRSLMESFFDADVIDVELLYDNAMLAVNYQLARTHKIKYILAGTNHATEGFRLPPNWSWLKYDKSNIRAIHRLNPQRMKMQSFPSIGIIEYLWHRFVLRISWVSMLDLMDYNKDSAVNYLSDNFAFKPYPYKHYESVFTRFYQGYLLPSKFGIDKRKVHFSNMILSGQMNRADAEIQLQSNPYPSTKELRNDIRFFLKKMNWQADKLEQYLNRPGVKHDYYKSNAKYWATFSEIKRTLRRWFNE
jgi:N-acetyl sugar amidotransferase